MMAQDLTKFTIVIVFLGVVLAVAIFRPQILPVRVEEPTDQPTQAERLTPVPTLGQHGSGFSSPVKQVLPTQGLEGLQDEQARLVQEQKNLRAEQNRLVQEWEELRAEQARLSQERVDLQDEQGRLAWEWKNLQGEREHLDYEQARLREKETSLRTREASLAERKQRVQGLWRFSLVALVVSSLMGVPSIAFLIVLIRHDRQVSGKQVWRDRTSEESSRERLMTLNRMARPVPPPTPGDNGRTREIVGQLL